MSINLESGVNRIQRCRARQPDYPLVVDASAKPGFAALIFCSRKVFCTQCEIRQADLCRGRVAAIIERAVSNGLTEVQVYRFPNAMCTDRGRAINQQETGWEQTLTGLPKEMYEFWGRQLRPRGYKIKFQIVDFPDGMPGDVGITLKWA